MGRNKNSSSDESTAKRRKTDYSCENHSPTTEISNPVSSLPPDNTGTSSANASVMLEVPVQKVVRKPKSDKIKKLSKIKKFSVQNFEKASVAIKSKTKKRKPNMEEENKGDHSPSLPSCSDDSSSENDFSLQRQVDLLTQNVKSLTEVVAKLTQNTNKSDERYSTSLNLPSTSAQASIGEFSFPIRERPAHTSIDFSSGLKAGDNLPEKIKQKIWDHKFIDFYFLIYPESDQSYNFSLNSNSDNPSLDLVPKKKRNLSEREWNSAFNDFLAVYCYRYPHELTELLTYSKFINGLMNSNSNWIFYDLRFRKDREFSLCKWTTIRLDLQLEANRISGQQKSQPQQQLNNKIPLGYCYAYHCSHLKCYKDKCTYKHTCHRCSTNHPSYQPCNGPASRSHYAGNYKKFREQPTNSYQSGRPQQFTR